jgi:hypothetical protein
MDNAVARDGENQSWGRMDAPASAKSYFLQVLGPRSQSAGTRNLREMSTLSTILDHLALGRVGQAADVATQRLKSVEMAHKDGHWNRSVFLELVPEESATLVSRDEHHLMQKESELHTKQFPKPTYKPDYQNFDKGKGKAKGQAVWVPNKNNKDKGKGKNNFKGKGDKPAKAE